MKNKFSVFNYQLSVREPFRFGIWKLSFDNFRVKTRKGFTLIETLVAISVLLVSLVGPLSIAAQALKSAYYARDEITAFYLAQEGLEYVQAVRDQNYLASPSQPWLTGLSACESATCTIDFPNFTNASCANNVCSPLLLDPATELYNTKSGNPSGFTRSVTILPVAGMPDEVEVKSTVSWVSAGISRSFTLSEYLFNWL